MYNQCSVCVVTQCEVVPVVCLFSQDYTDSPPESSQVIVVMDSFKSKIIRLRVCYCCCHFLLTSTGILQCDNSVAKCNAAILILTVFLSHL